MEADKTATAPDEARLAEIAYHKKQNRIVVYTAVPSMILYAGFYFHLSQYFQSSIFVLMIVNAVAGMFIGNRLQNIQSLTVLKRVSAGIAFGLLATNLLTGLWDVSIYYIVLPWIFLFPMAAVMFFSRKIGFIAATLFSVLALVFFLINDIPPWNAYNIKLFQFNAVLALLSILMTSVIYEKTRMKVQDDLAISEHQYKLAEMRQRETNVELQQEIERRRQSEKALVESELHYRALFEESSVALWEEDWSELKLYLDGLPQEVRSDLNAHFNNPRELEKCIPLMRVKAVNRATLKLYNADSLSTLLKHLSRIVAPEQSDFVVDQMLSLYSTGRYDAEHPGKTLDGKKLHLLVSSAIPAGYENSWEKVYSSIHDVTEKVAIEEAKKRVDLQMQNARQFQAIGTLAGGIAHQFNNALAVIYGSLDLLEMNSQGNMENRRFLTSLKTSAGRMSRLTDQLLAYAEGGKYQPRHFSVNDLVNDIISSKIMLRDSAIQVITQLGSDIRLTSGDITQIKMVVDAVLSNAFEAMQQGGIVKITTGHKLMGEPVTKTNQPTKPGDYTFICVEDNGTGMKEETLQRIFEPFFTTKIYGRGLGMAAAFGIIRNHDGMITVDSEPGKGACVVIYLPSSENHEKRLQSLS